MKAQIYFSDEHFAANAEDVAIHIYGFRRFGPFGVVYFQIGDELYQYSFDRSVSSISGTMRHQELIREWLKKVHQRWDNRRLPQHYLSVIERLVLNAKQERAVLLNKRLPETTGEYLREVSGTAEDPLTFEDWRHLAPKMIVLRSGVNPRQEVFFWLEETLYVYSGVARTVDCLSGDDRLINSIERIIDSHRD